MRLSGYFWFLKFKTNPIEAKQEKKFKLPDPNGRLTENGASDPDKISCPICAKMWHKSNLRNHLFYGHHMKTTEVEHVLIKLKNPSINHPKPEPAQTERTPCPKCDRSFKHWYNARR